MLVIIQVRPTVALESLHQDDQQLPGQYNIELHPSVDSRVAANAALDVFHSNVPVKVLEHFDIRAQSESGVLIELADGCEDCSYADLGKVVGSCPLEGNEGVVYKDKEFEITYNVNRPDEDGSLMHNKVYGNSDTAYCVGGFEKGEGGFEVTVDQLPDEDGCDVWLVDTVATLDEAKSLLWEHRYHAIA